MALDCNAFANNTVGVTMQQAACAGPRVANLTDHVLLEPEFLALVLDSVIRASGGVISIEDIPACDAAQALQNASCAMQTITPSYNLTVPQQQALILYVLNQFICNNP